MQRSLFAGVEITHALTRRSLSFFSPLTHFACMIVLFTTPKTRTIETSVVSSSVVSLSCHGFLNSHCLLLIFVRRFSFHFCPLSSHDSQARNKQCFLTQLRPTSCQETQTITHQFTPIGFQSFTPQLCSTQCFICPLPSSLRKSIIAFQPSSSTSESYSQRTSPTATTILLFLFRIEPSCCLLWVSFSLCKRVVVTRVSFVTVRQAFAALVCP